METDSEIKDLINEYFDTSEYKIIESILRGEKGTKVLEIFVDNKTGINIDEITQINKDLNELIDKRIIINDISNLVVSSPGVDRAIKFLWQFHKHTGRIIEMELNDGEKLEGRLTRISEEGEGEIEIEIQVKEKGKKITHEIRLIKFPDIKTAKVKISFSKNK